MMTRTELQAALDAYPPDAQVWVRSDELMLSWEPIEVNTIRDTDPPAYLPDFADVVIIRTKALGGCGGW